MQECMFMITCLRCCASVQVVILILYPALHNQAAKPSCVLYILLYPSCLCQLKVSLLLLTYLSNPSPLPLLTSDWREA